MTVRDDGEHVQTQSLADCSLAHWLTYIDETHGWQTTRIEGIE